MWDASKCALCGDCLARCPYVDYDKDRAAKEIKALMDGKEADILSKCINCVACNEYCAKGANPFDLICQRQEEIKALPVPESLFTFFGKVTAMPSEVVKGNPDRPVLSLCTVEPLIPRDAIEGQMFDGLTIVKGGEYFCYIGYVHLGTERLVKQNAQKFVDKMASLGAKEIVFIHDDCYSMIANKVPEYGIEVPFKPVHIFEYLLNYLRGHQESITKLGKRIAYQRPCASRYTPGKEYMLDEIFDLIGIERVDRKYDREEALCCGGGGIVDRIYPGKMAKYQDMNLTDAQEHGAEAMVFLCPLCIRGLGQLSQKCGLTPIFITDLCRMALGEKPFPV